MSSISTVRSASATTGSRGFRAYAYLAASTSLALFVFEIDSFVFDSSQRSVPLLSALADLRLPSLLLVTALAIATNARSFLRSPVSPGWRVATYAALWLVGCAASVHFFGVGRVPLPRWQDVVAFTVTGLLAEEISNRAIVLEAASRLWPPATTRHRAAIVYSAAVFALMHHQHHGFAFDGAAWLQVAWSFPLGILLAWTTIRSRSIWPTVVIHGLNNAIVQLV